MPQINNLIGPKSFELVRDRVASVLAIEILNQSTLTNSALSNAPVYTERFVPFSDTEMPAVNVMLARGDYGMYTAVNQDGTYIYNIDVYHKAKTTPDGRGDMRATKNLQQLVGVVQTILSHHRYNTLGFAPPFIERVEVRDIKFADPVNSKDSNSVVMARLTFAVRVPESISPDSAVLLDGYDTSVMIANSIDGYVFSGDGFPPVPPSCSPGQIRDENGVVLREVPSGGFVVLENNLIKNSDESYSVELLPEQALDLPNINITDSDGTLISYPSVKDFQCSPTVPPADATVTVNGNEFGTVESGGVIDIPVVNGGSNPVGTIDGGQVVIADSLVQINGTTVGDIVAEDSLSIAVELDGVPSGTWNAGAQIWEIDSTPSDAWVRPIGWLPLDNVTTGTNKFSGLFAVYENNVNVCTMQIFTGSHTINWGDGTTQITTNGVLYTKTYNYATLAGPILVDEWGFNYKMVVVNVGLVSSTGIYIDRNYVGGPNARTLGWLDIAIDCSTMNEIFVSTNISDGIACMLQRLLVYDLANNMGSLQLANCINLRIFKFPFNKLSISASVNFSNTFFNTTDENNLPLSINTNFANFNLSNTRIIKLGNLTLPNVTVSTQNFMLGSSNVNEIGNITIPLVQTIQNFQFGNYSLVKQGVLNTSTALTNINNAWYECRNIKSIRITDCSNVNVVGQAFYRNSSLESLILTGLRLGFNIDDANMSASALNDLFTSLGTASGSQTISIKRNPGVATCNTTIATAKGFTVVI